MQLISKRSEKLEALMGYLNKLANWYFSRRALSFWGILLIDNIIVYGTFLFMYLFFDIHERTATNLGHLSLNILVFLIFGAE